MAVRRQSRRLRKAWEGIDRERSYPLAEAVALVRRAATARFKESVDVAVKLGIDARRSDQSVRGVVALPAGSGRQVRVAVFCKGARGDEARAAGADIVGDDELVKKVAGGEIDFDRCIASPDMMAMVGQLGRILGPRGLMPNPKLGTVTEDVAAAVKAVKGGQATFRNEKGGVVHASVGRASFKDDDIAANVRALIDALNRARPQGVKGVYIQNVVLSSTMGVAVRVDSASLAAA